MGCAIKVGKLSCWFILGQLLAALFITQTISSHRSKHGNSIIASSSNYSRISLPNIEKMKRRNTFLMLDSSVKQRRRSVSRQKTTVGNAPVLQTDGLTSSGHHRSTSPELRAKSRRKHTNDTSISSIWERIKIKQHTRASNQNMRPKSRKPSTTLTIVKPFEFKTNRRSMSPKLRVVLARPDNYTEILQKNYQPFVPMVAHPYYNAQTKIIREGFKKT